MSTVTAICGKVGAGKTYFARKIMETQSAVLLSNDELLHDVFPNAHPGDQKELMQRIDRYLMKKAAELAARLPCHFGLGLLDQGGKGLGHGVLCGEGDPR